MSELSKQGELVFNAISTVVGIAGAVLLGAAAVVAVTAWALTVYRNRRKSKAPTVQPVPTRQRRFGTAEVVRLLAATGFGLLTAWSMTFVVDDLRYIPPAPIWEVH
ncbi:hypothetical protein AB0876_31955 [Mycobacterium sp. NPDC049093]